MPSSADSTAHQAGGAVRRFWWRTGQPARLAIGCLGVVTALAVTGAVAFSGEDLSRNPGNGGLDASGFRGDSLQVTVRAVTEVDLFEGADPVTGRVVLARVAGVRPMPDCWAAESRAAAQELLRGKDVRLVVKREDTSGGDRILVDVELPDGADYARTVVSGGVVQADLAARGELASDESGARLGRLGLWAAACAPGANTTPVSLPPTSTSAPSPTTTTATTTPETTTPEPPPPPQPTTTEPEPPDEEWDDSRLGKPCLFEGARRTTKDGYEIVCSRNGKNQLRWRRAD
ncbi:thermonuclease family protein [Lentzea sp. NPDC058450]|uniref:thermonuclease family protein n=1 Tax=Lentzea sp. NPDC058450 TaxID=3346505 RepID=UPI003656F680